MKNTLLRTNCIVCMIIILGFAVTSVISYTSNVGIYEKDIEQVSVLTSEGIYNDIATIFSQPVSVSLTMANDSLLKNFLLAEEWSLRDEAYLKEMKDYLRAYREKYNYDSVFLVSAKTNRYYHFEGVNRVLVKGDPENVWYYNFIENEDEYSLNVDNDQTRNTNDITVFVNCKIKGEDGSVMGVVGVGLQVNSLQELLNDYEAKYDITACLIDNEGTIEVSSEKTGYEQVNFFEGSPYGDRKKEILENRDIRKTFWYSNSTENGYVVTQYEPNLKWHLVVENDTFAVKKQLSNQLRRNALIILGIIVLVLVTITTVIKKYNSKIIALTISQELEYQSLLRETTEELYENISEFDITRNCAGGESTKEYLKSMGISGDEPYDSALSMIAKKQIKEEYTEGYLKLFSSGHVLEAYHSGINNLSYDFMVSEDGIDYRWVRISARIFFWNSDQSVRMITYRKNIDEERKRELMLLEEVQRDAMTGLYNKMATEKLIESVFLEDAEKKVNHAFLIFDIDNFKVVNDTMGHSFGDHVIQELTAEIKTQFREYDIVGRVGGDEFAVLMKNVEDMGELKKKLERVCAKLMNKDFGQGETYHISCCIGVALFPMDGTAYTQLYEKADQALYYTKRHGKSGFSVFGENI